MSRTIDTEGKFCPGFIRLSSQGRLPHRQRACEVTSSDLTTVVKRQVPGIDQPPRYGGRCLTSREHTQLGTQTIVAPLEGAGSCRANLSWTPNKGLPYSRLPCAALTSPSLVHFLRGSPCGLLSCRRGSQLQKYEKRDKTPTPPRLCKRRGSSKCDESSEGPQQKRRRCVSYYQGEAASVLEDGISGDILRVQRKCTSG